MKRKASLYLNNSKVQESILFMALGVSIFIYGMVNHYAVDISWGMSPYLFPVLISVFLMALSFSLFLEGRSRLEEKKESKNPNTKKVLFVIAASLIYYALIPVITFVGASIIFLAVLLWYLGEKRWFVILPVSLLTSFSVYFLFGRLLGVMLP